MEAAIRAQERARYQALVEAVETIARAMTEYTYAEDGANVAIKVARRALAALEPTQ